MPIWYYEKGDLKNTPSLADGLECDVEQRYRREGARFIINVGTRMGLRYDTMATGVVYFHRFYMFHSFRTFPRFVTACCCLFLAGKVEETPKKCKDIIKTARSQLTDQQFTQFGDDPKEEVMTLERILLQTIKFDLQVDHPYGYLLKYAKCLKGEKTKLQKLVQMAWTFVNDSLCTTLCLQWEPEIIGIALMYLAGKLSKFEILDWTGRTSKHVRWWDMFVDDMSIELLEDICHQVLDLYSTPPPTTPQDSPPSTPPTVKAHKIQTTPPSQALTTPPHTKIKETIPTATVVETTVVQPPPPVTPTPTIQQVSAIPVIQPMDRGDVKQLLPPPAPPHVQVLSVSPSHTKPLPPPPMPPLVPAVTEIEKLSRASIPNIDTAPPPPPPPYNFPVKPHMSTDENFTTTFTGPPPPPPPPPAYQNPTAYQPPPPPPSSFSQGKNQINPSSSYPLGPTSGPPPPITIHQPPSTQYGSFSQRPPYYPAGDSQKEYYPPVQTHGTSGFPIAHGSHNQMRIHNAPPLPPPPPPPHQFSGPPPSHSRMHGPGQFSGHQGMRMPPMQTPPRQVPPTPPNMGYPNRYGPPMDMSPNSPQRMPAPRRYC